MVSPLIKFHLTINYYKLSWLRSGQFLFAPEPTRSYWRWGGGGAGEGKVMDKAKKIGQFSSWFRTRDGGIKLPASAGCIPWTLFVTWFQSIKRNLSTAAVAYDSYFMWLLPLCPSIRRPLIHNTMMQRSIVESQKKTEQLQHSVCTWNGKDDRNDFIKNFIAIFQTTSPALTSSACSDWLRIDKISCSD